MRSKHVAAAAVTCAIAWPWMLVILAVGVLVALGVVLPAVWSRSPERRRAAGDLVKLFLSAAKSGEPVPVPSRSAMMSGDLTSSG